MIEKNNTQRVLEFFFTYPTKEVHLRELSREMKLSMPAILSAIKKLKNEGLVLVNKTKAITKVNANTKSTTFTRLKKVYNLEIMYTSGLVDFLYKEFQMPQAIICFGSYSRGDDTEVSDVDIAIIGGIEKDINAEKFERILKRNISIHHVKLDKISIEFKSNLCNGMILEGAL